MRPNAPDNQYHTKTCAIWLHRPCTCNEAIKYKQPVATIAAWAIVGVLCSGVVLLPALLGCLAWSAITHWPRCI